MNKNMKYICVIKFFYSLMKSECETKHENKIFHLQVQIPTSFNLYIKNIY